MKNAYEFRGDLLVVFIRCKGETKEALFDKDDFPKVSRYTWRLNKGRNTAYICANAPGANHGKKIWAHKLVCGAGVATKVDHRNYDGLDCRKANLRRLDHVRNALNARFGFIHPNNRTGERGVSFHEERTKKPRGKKAASAGRPWRAQLQFRRQKRHLGWYATKEAAAGAVQAELERRGLATYEPTAAEYERLEDARGFSRRELGGGT